MKYFWECNCGVTGEFESKRTLSLAESVREARRLHGDPICHGVPNAQTCGDPDVVVDDEEVRDMVARWNRVRIQLGSGFC